MINETVFLGACPVIRPEGIYIDGVRVIRLGLSDVGLGDVGDLLAYRQMWEPFIAAHLELWRHLNSVLEQASDAQKCPAGLLNAEQRRNLDPFCAALALSRIRVSDTDPEGILPQWNAWKNRSSSEVVAGARSMLEWHQEVVMRVGNQYKDDLVRISADWKLDEVDLPDLPTFSLQQELKARIEGAYITTKGVIQIIGYGVGKALMQTISATEAVAEGLTDTARELPKTLPRIGMAVAVIAVVVGGALLVYYVPRRRESKWNSTPSTKY